MTGAPAPRVSPGRTPQCGLMRAWTVSVSSGEPAGFCFPALVGGLLREETPRFVLGARVLPSTFHGPWPAWPARAVALAFTAGGAFVLLVSGVAQWIELRRHVPHAARWIAITAAGWGAGLLAFTAVSTPLWQPARPQVSAGAGSGAVSLSLAGGSTNR